MEQFQFELQPGFPELPNQLGVERRAQSQAMSPGGNQNGFTESEKSGCQTLKAVLPTWLVATAPSASSSLLLLSSILCLTCNYILPNSRFEYPLYLCFAFFCFLSLPRKLVNIFTSFLLSSSSAASLAISSETLVPTILIVFQICFK